MNAGKGCKQKSVNPNKEANDGSEGEDMEVENHGHKSLVARVFFRQTLVSTL